MAQQLAGLLLISTRHGAAGARFHLLLHVVPTETAQLQSGIPSRGCGSGIAVSVVLQTPLRADGVVSLQIEMAQKLLNSDMAELINKMKLAQQYVMTSLQQEYKKQMLTAAHALAVDAKNLLDVIDQARLKISQSRPH